MRRQRAGFSLLEILISLIILAVAITAILSLFAAGGSSYSRGVDYTNMSLIAEAAYIDIDNAMRNVREPRDIAGQQVAGFPQYRYDASFQPLDASRLAYVVKMKVKWLSEGSERSEEFQTIVLKK